jgi:hypothetical protein
MFVNISSTDKVEKKDSISECFVRPNGTGFSINMALAKLLAKNFSEKASYYRIFFQIDKDSENRLLKFTPTKEYKGNFRSTISTLCGHGSSISVQSRAMSIIHKDIDYVRLYVKETEIDEKTQKLKSFIVGY